MNIKVFEHPPSSDDLSLLGTTEEIPEDVEEAAAVLASIDKETGRTTDPVRMYMREMGTVELLDRSGEIRISQRIEEGIRQVLESLAGHPETISLVLADYHLVINDEFKLDDLICGFADQEDETPPAALGSVLEDLSPELLDEDALLEGTIDDEVPIAAEDTGPNPEIAKDYFARLYDAHVLAVTHIKAYGKAHPETLTALQHMAELFLSIKLTSRTVDKLTDHFRQLRNHVRNYDREIMQLCVEKAQIPRKLFIETFPGNETHPAWLETLIRQEGKKLDLPLVEQYREAILRVQKKFAQFEETTSLLIPEIKDVNRKMSIGEARRIKETSVNLRLVISIAEIHQPWLAVS